MKIAKLLFLLKMVLGTKLKLMDKLVMLMVIIFKLIQLTQIITQIVHNQIILTLMFKE